MTAPFQRAFREELLRVARRETRRRRLRRRSLRAFVAGLTAAGAAIGYGIVSDPAAADVDVRVDDGVVEVVLNSRDVTTEEVLKALAEHSIEATVDAVATGPSQVGLFTGAEVTGSPEAPRIEPVGAIAGAFPAFRLQEDWSGELVLHLGRRAESGEPYEAATPAFADGEPLHCAGVLGARLEDAVDGLVGLRATVEAMTDAGVTHLSLAEAVASSFGSWFVTGGRMLSADDLVLSLSAEAAVAESC